MTSEINIEALLSQEFDHTKNINYRLIEGQEQISSLAAQDSESICTAYPFGFL